jgi:hypothetical protein
MSEQKEKQKFEVSKLKTIEVSEIPVKASKGKWKDLIPILQNLIKTPTKALTVSEKEASLPALRNQIAKAVKEAKIEGIVLNIRTINKVQTFFISYKKPQIKKQ